MNLLSHKRTNLLNINDNISEYCKKYNLILISLSILTLFISYLIVLSLKSNIPYHTDSIVPIEQVKLLIDSKNVGIFDIRLARIPSIFPDLAIIYILIKFLMIKDTLKIIALYSFINCFLLLFGFTLILYKTFKSSKKIIITNFFIFISITFLIKFSFLYREIFGFFLTPLHQGGNIIMTIYSFIFILNNTNKEWIRIFNKKTNYFTFPLLIGSSIISNKLYAFTFIFPISLIFIFEYIKINNNNFKIKKIYFIKNYIFNRIHYKKIFLIFSIPIFLIINSILFFLNTQPMPSINLNIYNNLVGLTKFTNNSFIFQFNSLLYFLLVLYFLHKIFKPNHIEFNNDNLYLKNNLTPLFIGFSGLSPFIYIWFAENIISRYFLINFLLAPISISILVIVILEDLSYYFSSSKIYNTLIVPISLTFFITSFIILFNNAITYYNGSNYTYSSWPVRNSIKEKINYSFFNNLNLFKSISQAALISKSDFAVDHEQIHLLGLKNGLSDYWGSAVSVIGPHKLKVSPILPDGTPNLWGNNNFDFHIVDSNKIINYNFVYSRDSNFTDSIIKAYGKPSLIYKLQNEISYPKLISLNELPINSNAILIYKNNSLGWNKIKELIAK